MAFNRSRGLTSQFMREQLNTVHSEPQEDYSALDQDLSLFTNTTFHDFDTGAQIDFKADESPAKPAAGEPASTTSMMGEYGEMDFLNTPAGGSLLFPRSICTLYMLPPLHRTILGVHGRELCLQSLLLFRCEVVLISPSHAAGSHQVLCYSRVSPPEDSCPHGSVLHAAMPGIGTPFRPLHNGVALTVTVTVTVMALGSHG